jgi:tetratricopeptide (TPR) repeat protein
VKTAAALVACLAAASLRAQAPAGDPIVEQRTRQGWERMQAGRAGEAAEAFRAAIAADAGFAPAHLGLGVASASLGLGEESIAAFREAIRLRPAYVEAHYNLGVALERASRLTEALAAFRATLELRPRDANALFNLGRVQGRLERWTDAADAYERAIAVRPTHAPSHLGLGVAAANLGRSGRAVAALQEAVRLQPDHAEALAALGAVYGNLERWPDALAAFQKAVARQPDDASLQYQLGRAYARLGRPAEARGAFLHALAFKPDDVAARFNLGLACVDLGLKAEAAAAFEAVLRLDPGHTGARYNLAHARGDRVDLPLSSASAPAPDRDRPQTAPFTDITAASGITFEHQNSPTARKYLIETMGGGVALLDYDADGWLDVFFTNGARLADPMPPGAEPDKSEARFANRLYRNNRDGTFTDVTKAAGLAGARGYGMGVAVGDYDNDGRADLYVTNHGTNILYRNEGNGRFADVTTRAGVVGGGWSTSAGFFDYDNDGRLDLFVCRYLDWSFAQDVYCGAKRPGYREYCHPRNFPAISNLLFRNRGDGTFEDVSARSGVAALAGKSLGVAFADYNGDGWTDVYVANDAVPAFLLRNDGQGRFTDAALTAGVAVNAEGAAVAGMGVDFADYDDDGRPDLFVSTLSGETYSLYRNLATGFVYTTQSAGVAAPSMPGSGWGTRLFDYDNDGWKDLFVAQGHVLDTIELTSDHLRYQQPPLLLRGGNGRFVPASTAGPFAQAWAGRGAAFGDLDNDGDVDVVVANCGQRATVLRNDAGAANHWLGLRLQGTRSNADGLGARVSATTADGRTQHYIVTTASSYLSASDKRVLVGLGTADKVSRLEVRWPSGLTQVLSDVAAGQTITAREP